MTERITAIDSHTGGEPTRTLVGGVPDLGSGSMAERREIMRRSFDHVRRAVVTEPRASDVVVGAMLCPPERAESVAGVIFFNNVGYIGMCGHGTIGVVRTLAHLGRIGPGRHQLDTPVGPVVAELESDGRVSFENVPSYRHKKDQRVDVPGVGTIHGDIAWGGNWFFLVAEHGQELTLDRCDALTAFCWAIRESLDNQRITGADDGHIDHIELFGPPESTGANSRSFVLCPGRAYDRSPCGTGTSAKLACLAADGKLEPGAPWRQESIVGSVFEGSYRLGPDNTIIPRISGIAYVNAEVTILLDPLDPFCWGINSD